MTECMLERSCANAGGPKCTLCQNIAKTTKSNHGYEHHPAFKDKVWYAKTIPYIQLRPLFENLPRGRFCQNFPRGKFYGEAQQNE